MQVGGTFIDNTRDVIFEDIDFPILDSYKEIVKGKVSSKVLASAFNIDDGREEQSVNMVIVENIEDGSNYMVFINSDTVTDRQRLIFLPITPYNPKLSMESMN